MASALFFLAFFLCPLVAAGQAGSSREVVSSPADGRYYNKEYDVVLHLGLSGSDVVVPGQEVLGGLPGYLANASGSFHWLMVDATGVDASGAKVQMVNDYGSEDLTAQVVVLSDSTVQLRQLSGSSLKMPRQGKWQKLPRTLLFLRRP